MKNTASSIGNIISAICAILVIGAVLFWAPPCQGMLELASGNMTPMRCVYTGKIALLISFLLIATCLASLAFKRSMVIPILALSISLMLLAIESPITIGVCKSEDMACWNMAHWLVACGGASAIASLLGTIAKLIRKQVRS